MQEIEKLLRENRPEVCDLCLGKLVYRGEGIYRCKSCGHEVLDDFGKIKRYIEENGPSPAISIAKDTGVSREVIDLCLQNGKVEIPEGEQFYLKCAKCGCDIRYGRFCQECKQELAGSIKAVFDAEAGERAIPTHSEASGKIRYLSKKER